ncbi:uncharacterized protein LOC121240933 [Juglans microcarpa x Juglans regia]|uniref:uncharacterized protein LOC121240933 n=1 Tax=Juglans microcarpa x Juglans regia TaxID=2249226 RepID=UPI001B7E615B|nr:uncharacterized protein LOC121240933 [Juglans microcarpa x Juglans regia]
MALKLDISKAYDRIEWEFLKAVMVKMGFDKNWIAVIMRCVATVTYSHGEALGAITGVPLGRNHLQANCLEWSRLFHLLELYEHASGQRLNKDKTSISFNKNTRGEARDLILQIAGIQSSQPYEKYLGLPSLIGRSKTKGFKCILDKAIPTYSMGVFKIPKANLRELNRLMKQYWWGQKAEESKINWCSWEKMAKAKACGGLRFRDLESFNLAMLAKQGWRLLQSPNSLVARVLSAKYFPNGDFLGVGLTRNPSQIWRSIMAAKPLLDEGLFWHIGNGCSTRIWLHKWLPIPNSY